MKFDVDKDLRFELINEKRKTQVYSVVNMKQLTCIGIIKWHPSWRHYCFFPEEETVYSDRCLLKIGNFLEVLNKNHKIKNERK
ncbi:MAG: hypothetical protein ACTSXD_07090 [Candidatus Heimdallarchaeaceae archaeon]